MTPEFTPTLPMHAKSRSLGLAARILATVVCALLLFCGIAPAARAHAQTPTLIVVRAMPVKAKKAEDFPALPPLTNSDIGEVKIGGKTAPVTGFVPLLHGPHSPVLQLMVLLDSEQMLGANGQFADIKQFFKDLPPNVEIGVGWLLQGDVEGGPAVHHGPRTRRQGTHRQRRGQKRQTRRTTMGIHFSASETWPPTGPIPIQRSCAPC